MKVKSRRKNVARFLLLLSLVGVVGLFAAIGSEHALRDNQPLIITVIAISFFVLSERVADLARENEETSVSDTLEMTANELDSVVTAIPTMLASGGQLVVFASEEAQAHIHRRAETALIIKNTSLRYNTRKYNSHAENVLAWIAIKVELMRRGVVVRELVSSYVKNDDTYVDFLKRIEAAKQDMEPSVSAKLLERFSRTKPRAPSSARVIYEVAYIDDVLHPLIQLTHLRFSNGHRCVYFGWQYLGKDANKVFYSENDELADFLESYFDVHYTRAQSASPQGEVT